MQEIHDFGRYKLLVQLVPETGENNFQYLVFDKDTKQAISIDCYDAPKACGALDGFMLIASLGQRLEIESKS